MPIELLAPAGDLERAKTAIRYGADAVYVGGKAFSLRSRASNFTIGNIKELVDFAHRNNAKVHVTVNILPHEEDLEGLDEYLKALDEAGVDAVIAASPHILLRAKELGCSFETHVSTQRSLTNANAVKLWQKAGMDRAVLGRECTLEDIHSIKEKTEIPLEVFIHGGMCISCSGRCVLSNHLTNRDANRGGCAQSCRWKYDITQDGEDRTDEAIPFSMSSKDLMGLEHVKELMDLGITSLKIEGRMKSHFYLANVVHALRTVIDQENPDYETIRKNLAPSENRPAGPGFLEGQPDAGMQLYRNQNDTLSQAFVAEVVDGPDEEGYWTILTRNKTDFTKPHRLFGPGTDWTTINFTEVKDNEGIPVTGSNTPMRRLKAKWEGPAELWAMITKE